MLACDLFPPILFVLVTTTTTQTTKPKVLTACSSNNQCPAQSSCTVRHPDGLLCICNKGLVPSLNMEVCEIAVYLSQRCITKCAGLSVLCDGTSKLCMCYDNHEPAADNKNCVPLGKGLLGEACGTGCAFSNEQVCVGGVCSCMEGLRPMTEEEVHAFSNLQRQCITLTYRLDGPTLPTTITATKQPPSPPRTTTTATTTTRPTIASTPLISSTPSTIATATGGSTVPVSQITNEAQSLDGGAGRAASHTSGMRTGMAVGISLALLVTLIALGVVVVVRKRKTQRDGINSSKHGLGSKNKNLKVRGTCLRDSRYVTESTIDGDWRTSLSTPATGTLPDVLVRSTEIPFSTGSYDNGGHVTDGQDGNGADSFSLPDEKVEGAKLPSIQDHSVMYSNFKIKENKAKVVMEKPKAEETHPGDSLYNTLSIANVKSRDDEANQTEDYNTLYNMKI